MSPTDGGLNGGPGQVSIEAVWERADRLGWRAVELAAWRWTALEAAAGRTGWAFFIETELVARGVEGLGALWEVGMLADEDVAAIVAFADERAGLAARSLVAA